MSDMREKSRDNKSDDNKSKKLADKTPKGDDNLHKSEQGKPQRAMRSRTMRIVLEACSVALSLPILWLAALGILMNRESIDLTFVKPHYEHWFSHAFDGKETDIETYSARWLNDEKVFEVHAHNIHITDHGGSRQTIKDVRGSFRIKDGSWVSPQLVGLEIAGGSLTITRNQKKSIEIALGTPTASQDIGALSSTQTPTMGGGLLGDIESVIVNDADVFLNDKISGLQFAFSDLSGSAHLRPNYLKIVAAGEVVQDEIESQALLSPFSLDASVDLNALAVDLDLAFNNLNLAKVFARYPESLEAQTKSWSQEIVASFVKLDAPLDLMTTLKLGSRKSEGGARSDAPDARMPTKLQALQFNLIAGQGQLQTGKTFKPFSHAHIAASYNGKKQYVELNALEIESDALNLDAQGVLKKGVSKRGVLQNQGKAADQNWTKNVDFSLDVSTARLNPGIRFDGPISIKKSHVSGYFNLTKRYAYLDKIALDFGDFQTDVSGEIARGDDGLFNQLDFNGQILGTITRPQILSFWPKDFARGARNWIENSLQTGVVTNLKLRTDLDANDLKSGHIANDHLNVSFDFKDGDVQYMRKMPWLRNVVGAGILQGNQADVFLHSGSVDGLDVQSGKVTIPKLSPHGGDFTIDLKGTGTISEMLRVSNFPPFEFSKNYGLTPSEFGGKGNIELHITRPLLQYFDQNRIVYELHGAFTDVALPVGIGDKKFNSGVMSLQADKDGISVTGSIKLGGWQTNLDWIKPLSVRNTPAKFSVSGVITRDDLDNFGIGLRRHFGGKIGLLIKGESDGISVNQADVYANFREADVNIGTLWYKARGEAGKMSGRIALGEDGSIRADNLVLSAQGLDMAGTIAIAPNFQLQSLDMPLVKIADFIDAKVTARPDQQGRLLLNMSGNFLNVEPWVKQAFHTQASTLAAPIDLSASFKSLNLGHNYQLTNAVAIFSHSGAVIKHAVLSGLTDQGAFRAEIIDSGGAINISENKISTPPQLTALRRKVEIEIPDASRAAMVFFSLGNIKGGKLSIKGTLPPITQSGGFVGNMSLKDFTLVRAPAFAQILSLASLTGIADTMGGAGLAFDEFETQFSYENGQLKIRDGRASGRALGLTGAGNIDMGNKTLDLNGVLVPSYTVNSVLGHIPLLGDIIVGKKGEGMFALNYTIKGRFEKTQVSVNPLSALTPGFLRRIFDVKRDKIEDDVVIDLIKKQEQTKQSKKKND